jgi:heat shock protein beta
LCFVNHIISDNYYFDLMLIMQNRSTFQFQALDKIRFLSLTEKEILGEGDNTKLDIQVSYLATY